MKRTIGKTRVECMNITEDADEDLDSEEEKEIMKEIRDEITKNVRQEMKSELELYQAKMKKLENSADGMTLAHIH